MIKMKKAKEISVFEGNLKENYLVQKSEPLLLMRSVPFELGELKILDTYLSRINSHDDSCRTVTFTKTEYEQLMGLSNVDIRTLKKYTKSMLQKVVELPMPGGYVQFTLFTRAACKTNDYGQQIVELTCSEEAKTVFFNIEGLRYLQYELKNTLSLTSKYSFLLYLYIRKERFRENWEIPLAELREQKLDCKNDTYSSFKYFKRDILDKAVNEINKKTDVDVSYETIKKGRYVVSIRFIYHKKEQMIEAADVDYSEIIAEDEPNEAANRRDLWKMPLEEFSFSPEQLDELRNLIFTVPKWAYPPNQAVPGDEDFDRHSYVMGKVLAIKNRNAVEPIRDKFAYLKTIINRDIEKWK